METTKKPPTKIEWILDELHKEEFFPSEVLVNKILAGEVPEYIDDALVDIIEALDAEWEAK